MRVLLGAIALLAAGCDPPPPSYPQYQNGDPNPPPTYSVDPSAAQGPTPQNGQPPPGYGPNGGYAPNAPNGGYAPNAPNGGYAPNGPNGGYAPNAPNGGYAPNANYAPPPPGYTSTAQPPPPGYTSTAPAGPPAPAAPPTGAAPMGPPAPAAPPPGAGLSIQTGPYACWQIGMSGYVASNLVSIDLSADGSYHIGGRNNAGGTYRTDTVSIYLSGGPLDGWVGAIGANAKGPLVRFRPDVPNDPGHDLHQGDQLCFLHF